MLVPEEKYWLKCPYYMDWQYVTIHNTANRASAMAEASYMVGNDSTTSWHYAVDDYRAVQCLPLNRNGWHAGDLNGPGNRTTIGIEICYSLDKGDPRYPIAQANSAILTARLLKSKNYGVSRIKIHMDWSGKYCPHRMLDNGHWDAFYKAQVGAVIAKMNESGAKPPKPVKPTQPVYHDYPKGNYELLRDLPRYDRPSGTPLRTVAKGTIVEAIEEIRSGVPGVWIKTKDGYFQAQSWNTVNIKKTTKKPNIKKPKPIVYPNYPPGNYEVIALAGLHVREKPRAGKIYYTLKTGDVVKAIEEIRSGVPGVVLRTKDGYIAAQTNKYVHVKRTSKQPKEQFKPYLVKVKIKDLNIRTGAGTNYKAYRTIEPGTYTIIEEAYGQGASVWGKLKSGAGWISLDFVEKV